jgi:hypothetical protein
MMEAARISETLVDNYFTRQYVPEDNSELRGNQFMTEPEVTHANGKCVLMSFSVLFATG